MQEGLLQNYLSNIIYNKSTQTKTYTFRQDCTYKTFSMVQNQETIL